MVSLRKPLGCVVPLPEMKAGCNVFQPSIIANPGWFSSVYSETTPEIGLNAALVGDTQLAQYLAHRGAAAQQALETLGPVVPEFERAFAHRVGAEQCQRETKLARTLRVTLQFCHVGLGARQFDMSSRLEFDILAKYVERLLTAGSTDGGQR